MKRKVNPRETGAADKAIGQHLRKAREEAGYSQQKLAELVGITFQQIQKYEKGSNRISASRLIDIAAALKVRISYFFDGLEKFGPTPPPAAKKPQKGATPVPKKPARKKK